MSEPDDGREAPAPASPVTRFTASVVIPLGSIIPELAEQLDALARQDATFAWELILAHNWPGFTGDNGASVPPAIAHVRQIDASAVKGPSHARNAGAAVANSPLVLFCDADDIVCDGWVSAMVRSLQRYDAVGGRVDEKALNPKTASWRPNDQNDHLPALFDFLPRTIGANCAVRVPVFAAVGGFDEQVRTHEDTIFSWRLQLAGYSLGFAADAIVYYRHRTDLWSMSKQHFAYGRSSPRLSVRFAANGFVYSPARIAIGSVTRVVPRPGNWPVKLTLGWFVRQISIATGTMFEWSIMLREQARARRTKDERAA